MLDRVHQREEFVRSYYGLVNFYWHFIYNLQIHHENRDGIDPLQTDQVTALMLMPDL